ncbi:MAG: RNA 2',3'-cyclic phosphodiesterase [Pseudomonadales bacterium]
MRLFFGLDLPVDTKLAIDQWRNSNYSLLGPGVPAANFHITLAFLGECKPQQIEQLLLGASGISAAPFELVLNDIGFWQKNGILWMGSRQQPDELHALAKQCRAIARGLQLDKSGKQFQPHVTLWRRQLSAPPPPVNMPSINMQIQELCLFESVIYKGTVTYNVIESWNFI